MSQPGSATNTSISVPTIVIRAFGNGYFQIRYAAAIAGVLFLTIVAFTISRVRRSKRWGSYEAGNE